MFCDNCGTKLKDGAMFCQGCGQRVIPQPVQQEQSAETEVLNQEWQQPQQEWQQPQQEWQQPQQEWQAPLQPELENNAGKKKGKAGKTIAIIAILLLVVGVGAYLATLLLGGGPEKVVNDYIDAFMKADGEKVLELSAPKKTLEAACEEEDYDMDELSEEMEEYLNYVLDTVEEQDATLEMKIKCSENINKLDELEEAAEDMDIESIDDFRDYMDENLGDYEFDADKIASVYAVEVEMTVETDDDEHTNTVILFPYKYKGKWYVQGITSMY